MSDELSAGTPEASKFRARERESNKFELSLRAQPKLNNKIVKGVATCHFVYFVYLLFPADSDLKVRVRLISVMQASTSVARAKSVKSV